MTEAQLKRLAKRLGYRFYRSTRHRDTIDNMGGYRMDDVATNTVIDGDRYTMTLEDVERRLTALT